jgi:hypothetical protein
VPGGDVVEHHGQPRQSAAKPTAADEVAFAWWASLGGEVPI